MRDAKHCGAPGWARWDLSANDEHTPWRPVESWADGAGAVVRPVGAPASSQPRRRTHITSPAFPASGVPLLPHQAAGVSRIGEPACRLLPRGSWMPNCGSCWHPLGRDVEAVGLLESVQMSLNSRQEADDADQQLLLFAGSPGITIMAWSCAARRMRLRRLGWLRGRSDMQRMACSARS